MKKIMKDYRERTKKQYPLPSSVQELLPIVKIARDGVFQLEDGREEDEKQYDKAYLFDDTNFATMDDMQKADFLKLYVSILNSMNVSFKIILMNSSRNMAKIRKQLFLHTQKEYEKEYARDFNSQMEDALLKGRSGIEMNRIFLISCRKKSVEEARDFFRSIEANLTVNFDRLQSRLIPLDASDRMALLDSFYHPGREESFRFDFDQAIKRKVSWKDLISPQMIRHVTDEYGKPDGITLQVDDHFVRVLYVPDMPSAINPDTLSRLMAGQFHLIFTIDVASIPRDVQKKTVDERYMENGRAIEKQQESHNRNQAWSTDISLDRRMERDELEFLQDVITNQDENLFYVALYAVVSAENLNALERSVTTFTSTAEGEGFRFRPASQNQLEALNTALPTGARFATHMYPLLAQPLAALTPFMVHELNDPDGLFYGINQISKNVLIGNRKLLTNPHGFILGKTGGGKGFATKLEVLQVLLKYEDDIILIDPQNEYEGFSKVFRGQFIDFGSESNHNLNPLDIGTYKYMSGRTAFLRDKTDLMLGIFGQICAQDLSAQQKSIIGRITQALYKGLDLENPKTEPPTLVDFYERLGEVDEYQAQDLQLALELFVTGSLNMFSRQTNVNTDNRFVVYGISDLGQEQFAVGILIMLESIRARIARNFRKGRATWLLIDEFHNLAGDYFSAKYLEKIWKEVRKLGGVCTGITQNMEDLTQSKVIETMLSNSEYVSFLSAGPLEEELIRDIFSMSDNLIRYIHNAQRGCGLLKFGEKYIPKDARLKKGSPMYDLFNTDFHEIQRKKDIKNLQKNMDTQMTEEIREVMELDPTEEEKKTADILLD